MRKKLVSGVATVALVATFSGKASAATHTVQPGDSLWKIASKYQTTVTKLKQLNNLKSDIIYPRQQLKVDGKASAASVKTTPTAASGAKSTSGASTYTVKPGDYLGKIASAHNMSVARLKQLNGLSSDLIRVGQVLKVSGTASGSSAPVKSTSTKSNTASSGSASGNGTYRVVAGDTLGKIAQKYRTTVTNLKKINGLSSDLIYVGQTLKVSGTASSSSSPAKSTSTKSNTTSSGSTSSNGTYRVVAGDTLGKIAQRHGTTVANLKRANGLSSDLIYVGQVLKLSGTATQVKGTSNVTAATAAKPAASGNVVQIAKQHVGTRYAWGGSSPSGFDCSGFIYYAFKTAGHNVSRTSADGYYNRSYHVNSPQPGDLVFFRNTYKAGISHLGIYLGGGQFIHAGNNGVEITSLSNSYWKSKFDSYKRFY